MTIRMNKIFLCLVCFGQRLKCVVSKTRLTKTQVV